MCDVPTLPPASRTLRFTRSMKAVFSRPEKPYPCKVAVRAASVPAPHHARDPYQLSPPVTFLHLPVDQPCRYLPLAHVAAPPTHLKPLSKMSRERIEVQIEAITGEERETVGSQSCRREWMSRCAACWVRGPRWSTGRIGARINGQPQKDAPVWNCAAWCEFRLTAGAEGALMEELSVPACASEPVGDGGLTVTLRPARQRKHLTLRPARDPHHGDPAREGVCKRYKGVWRRAVKVLRQAGQSSGQRGSRRRWSVLRLNPSW